MYVEDLSLSGLKVLELAEELAQLKTLLMKKDTKIDRLELLLSDMTDNMIQYHQ